MDASVASSQRDLVDSPLRHKGEVSQRQELGVVQAKDRLGCTNGLSPEDESEVDEEQSTAILAVCRHGDTLGLAAVREAYHGKGRGGGGEISAIWHSTQHRRTVFSLISAEATRLVRLYLLYQKI